MKRRIIKNSWFTFMLTVFVVPHVSNLLHYVVFEHNYTYKSNQTEWKNADTVHYCEQYLFKFSPAVEIVFHQWSILKPQFYNFIPVEKEVIYKYNSNLPIRTRGPPDVSFLTEFTLLI